MEISYQDLLELKFYEQYGPVFSFLNISPYVRYILIATNGENNQEIVSKIASIILEFMPKHKDKHRIFATGKMLQIIVFTNELP